MRNIVAIAMIMLATVAISSYFIANGYRMTAEDVMVILLGLNLFAQLLDD